MKRMALWAIFFLATFTQNVYTATRGEILKKAISEKFLHHSGDKNVLNDAFVNKILNIYAPVSKGFDNDLCRNHGKDYRDGVKKGEKWALKMFDSSSKVPDGLLMANLEQLGNYDECMQIEDVPSEFGAFSGQHCMVSMLASGATVEQQPALQRIHELQMAFRSPNVLAAYYILAFNGVPFKWSICVPSSCRAQDLQQHLQTALPGNLTVKDVSCNSKATDYPFSSAEWFAVGFMAFFAILVVLSTVYDLMYLNSDSRHPVLAAFSLYSNGGKLLSAPTSSPDDLPCLHGVRFLSMAWVVLAHRYAISSVTPSVNRAVLLEYVQDWNHIFCITMANVSVDSFFLLSGTLVCYIFMKEMGKGASFNIFLYYIHRYIRLTPAYAVVILISATLFKYSGDGPLWPVIRKFSNDHCQHGWWIGLLYVNNYVGPRCVIPAWYVSLDMQLFWLSPLVLLPLWKWPKLGKALLGVLIGIGLLISFLVPYINELPGTFVAGGGDVSLEYFPTHTRFTPWLIGIGLGYILHKTKKTTIRLSKPLAALGWFLSFGLVLTSWLLIHRFFQYDHPYERALESIYTCLMRPAWALGLAWLIFACVKGYGGFINTFLSWSFFQVLSRLTYSVFLIHPFFLVWDFGSTKAPVYLSDRTIYFGELVFIFPIAFLLSVVFEAPAIIIERHFLGGLNKKAITPAKKEVATNLHDDLEVAVQEPTNDLEVKELNTLNTIQRVYYSHAES